MSARQVIPASMRTTSTRALSWLAARADCYLPADGIPPSEASLTALAELSLFLGLTARTHATHDALIYALADRANASFQNSSVTNFYRAAPPQAAIGFVMTWLGLSKIRTQTNFALEDVRRYAVARRVGELAGSLTRIMESRWALDQLQLSDPKAQIDVPWQALLESDLAANQPFNSHGCYTLTHAIFYLTDFGTKALGASHLGSVLSEVIESVNGAITANHWDLISESILAWRCLSNRAHETIVQGARLLNAVQLSDGSFPAGESQPIAQESIPERVLALRRYHACLTAAMACLDLKPADGAMRPGLSGALGPANTVQNPL